MHRKSHFGEIKNRVVVWIFKLRVQPFISTQILIFCPLCNDNIFACLQRLNVQSWATSGLSNKFSWNSTNSVFNFLYFLLKLRVSDNVHTVIIKEHQIL